MPSLIFLYLAIIPIFLGEAAGLPPQMGVGFFNTMEIFPTGPEGGSKDLSHTLKAANKIAVRFPWLATWVFPSENGFHSIYSLCPNLSDCRACRRFKAGFVALSVNYARRYLTPKMRWDRQPNGFCLLRMPIDRNKLKTTPLEHFRKRQIAQFGCVLMWTIKCGNFGHLIIPVGNVSNVEQLDQNSSRLNGWINMMTSTINSKVEGRSAVWPNLWLR